MARRGVAVTWLPHPRSGVEYRWLSIDPPRCEARCPQCAASFVRDNRLTATNAARNHACADVAL